MPLHQDPAWQRGAAYLAGVPETNNPGKESKMIGQEEEDLKTASPYKGLCIPKAWLSLSSPMHLSICIFTFPISFLLLSLPSAFLPESFLGQGRQEMGIQALASGLCGLWLGFVALTAATTQVWFLVRELRFACSYHLLLLIESCLYLLLCATEIIIA